MVEATRALHFRSPSRVLAGYLGGAPLAHALFRIAEALPLSRQYLDRPVLDLGCGAGEFAALALASTVDIGVDVDPARLRGAAAGGRYNRFVQADARRIPLEGALFASVLSVSALEHMPEPDAVLGEVYRLLRPGGTFVGTLVLADLHDHLFYPALLRRMCLGRIARWYEAAQDRCFRHRTLLTKEAWEALFSRHGLRLHVSKRIVSPRLTRWWDMLLPAALPGWLLRRYRLRLNWRPAWLARILARYFEPLLSAECKRGSVLLFVAQKDEPRIGLPGVRHADSPQLVNQH